LKKISHFPLILISLSLMAGIIGGNYLHCSLKCILILWTVSFISSIFLHFWQIKHFRKIFLLSFAIIATGFSTGLLLHYRADQRNFKNHYTHYLQDENILQLQITKALKKGNAYAHYEAEIKSLNNQPVFGKILLNKPIDSLELSVGNHLQIIADSSSFNLVSKAMNPFGFNYQKFLSRKQIYHQINIDKTAYHIEQNTVHNLNYYAEKIRHRIQKSFIKGGLTPQTYQIANALFLGERQNLSKDIYNDFQKSGTVHVLAISGLHIGILLLFLNFIFKPVKRKSNILFLLITIGILWFYAFITGFSPSVLRAVIMFSFLQLGLHLNRKTNIYNSLFAAAFVMILINPNVIYEIGFQMSFAAVLAIVSFYPIFSSWVNIRNKYLKWFADLFWVSISAQLGVLPISLYYFHQFPVYFFIANLLIIPLLFLILFTGFSAIFLSLFGILIKPVYQILDFLLQTLLYINTQIANWQYNLVENIYFPAKYVLVSIAGLFVVYLFLKKPKKQQAQLILLLWILLFQIIILTQEYHRKKQQNFYVFHQYKTAVSGQNTGKKLIIFQNDSLISPYLKQDLQVPYKPVKYTELQHFQEFDSLQIFHIDSLGIYQINNYHPDIVAVHYSPKINFERMLQQLQPQQIVIDASNYPSFIKRWKITAKQYQIPFYDTHKNGAFIISKQK